MFNSTPRRSLASLAVVIVVALVPAGVVLAETGQPGGQRGGPAADGQQPDPAVRSVAERVHQAIRAQVPSIAKPIVDDAVKVGTITQAQADEILQRLTSGRGGPGGCGCKRGGHGPPPQGQEGSPRDRQGSPRDRQGAPPNAAVRSVLDAVHQAIRAAVPGIAKPILDEAVKAGTITQAQADQILQRVTRGPKPCKRRGQPDQQGTPA